MHVDETIVCNIELADPVRAVLIVDTVPYGGGGQTSSAKPAVTAAILVTRQARISNVEPPVSIDSVVTSDDEMMIDDVKSKSSRRHHTVHSFLQQYDDEIRTS